MSDSSETFEGSYVLEKSDIGILYWRGSEPYLWTCGRAVRDSEVNVTFHYGHPYFGESGELLIFCRTPSEDLNSWLQTEGLPEPFPGVNSGRRELNAYCARLMGVIEGKFIGC